MLEPKLHCRNDVCCGVVAEMEKNVLFTLLFLDGFVIRLLAGVANLCRRSFAADADPRNAMIVNNREDVEGGDTQRHQSDDRWG